MSNISTLVRAARHTHGLTQSQLANRARVDQSRVSRSESRDEDPRFGTADRLLAAAGHRLYSAPTRRDDAATAAEGIREALRSGRRDVALRHLVQLGDDLHAERGLLRGVLTIAEPATTGSHVWDAALAGLVAWRLGEEGLPTPAWTDAPHRRLARKRSLGVDTADPIPSTDDVPSEFLERGVLVWRDTFASV